MEDRALHPGGANDDVLPAPGQDSFKNPIHKLGDEGCVRDTDGSQREWWEYCHHKAIPSRLVTFCSLECLKRRLLFFTKTIQGARKMFQRAAADGGKGLR